jgi:hypothetical protein
MRSERVCCCKKCYSVIKTYRGRRTVPGILHTGDLDRQYRTAYIFFEEGCADAVKLRSACLYVFVQRVQTLCRHIAVCIMPVLPCGAPMPVDTRAAFEVKRGYCGWISVDVLPLLKTVEEELDGAPFGLVLSVDAPAFIVFSAASDLRPRLVLDEAESCGCLLPCAEATDICAPACPDMRVESQTWEIAFADTDSSVIRRVDRLKQGTFFITNDGKSDLTASVETGFDGENWATDTQKQVLPGETQAVVAKYYGRFYRVTLAASGTGKARVAFIGQYDTR